MSLNHECGADCACAEVVKEPEYVSSGENKDTERDDNDIDLDD